MALEQAATETPAAGEATPAAGETTPAAEATPAAETTPAAPEVDESTPISQERVREIMNFDPFAEGMEGDTEAGSTEEPAGSQAGTQATETATQAAEREAQEAAAAAAGATPVATPPVVDPTARAIQEQTELLRKQMALQQPAAGTPEEEAVPSYMFNLNDELVNAIRSENPAHTKQALTHIINQIGTIVHKNVRDEYRGFVGTAVQDYVQRHAQTQRVQSEVETDFYGKYPEMNTASGRLAVSAAADEVLKEPGNAGTWSEVIRDKIAARAKENARILAGLPAGGQTPAPAVVPAQNTLKSRPKPPAQTTPTTRPAAQRPEGQADDVADTLFGSG